MCVKFSSPLLRVVAKTVGTDKIHCKYVYKYNLFMVATLRFAVAAPSVVADSPLIISQVEVDTHFDFRAFHSIPPPPPPSG